MPQCGTQNTIKIHPILYSDLDCYFTLITPKPTRPELLSS